jgi:hypothetical protein
VCEGQASPYYECFNNLASCHWENGHTLRHINMPLIDLLLVDMSVRLSKYLFVPYFSYSFTNLRIYLMVIKLRHKRIMLFEGSHQMQTGQHAFMLNLQ